MAVPRTPYSHASKVCTKCGEEKTFDQFYARKNRAHGLTSICKQCESARKSTRDFQQKKESYERRKGYYLDESRRRTYGITPEQYRAMVEQQDNKCAICGQPERKLNKSGDVKSLAVDHDHETNLVRGLLCSLCNVGLGYFGDSLELMEKAMAYLSNSKLHIMEEVS